jgi:lipid-binding SYLF domain-containing protein
MINTSALRRFVGLAFALTLGAAANASDRANADALVERARATIEEFSRGNEFATLGPALRHSRAVLIFPRLVRAGFVLGGSGGSGVLLVRDETSGRWRGPAFYTMGSASLGLQAGASTAEVVMVVGSQKALDSLYTNKLKLGGDASVAIGPKGVGTGASASADFIVYAKVRGAFAGVSVDGAILDVREALNAAYYGKPATPVDILVRRTVNNEGARRLHRALEAAVPR